MCGICGEFRASGLDGTELASLTRCMELMARRGPDDHGYWTDKQACALGFRRLSILDLSSAGHQPMLTPEGRHALVFNGEVYNFRELRQELEQTGVAFRSTGDTEVVLQALVNWGKKALERFNGMFALALYDKKERRLLLARDPVGIKPLYYLLDRGTVVFGSQFNQLTAHPASRRCKVNPDALGLYLRLGYIPAPYALLKNTHMLEPGSWLEIDATGKTRQGRYFEFPVFQAPDLSGDEAIEAVNAEVQGAVKRQMVSDVPVGCFLSGGIDSPLVAAKMKAALGKTFPTFTIGTGGDKLDESSDATAYAQELGSEHVLWQVKAEDALALLDDVVTASSEPFADDSIFPTLLVSRLARERVKVMLSGDGGDELFWGYFGRFASVLKVAKEFRHPYVLRRGKRVARRALGRRNPGPHLVQPSIGTWYRVKHAWMFEEQIQGLFPAAPGFPEECKLFQYDGHDLDETAQWLRWNEFVAHLTKILLKVDRASMHQSLEVRVPLLDLQVVKLAARIDWRSCLDLKRKLGKLPLRRSLARHLRHQTCRKRGFSVPTGQWLRGPLRERLEMLKSGREHLLGLQINRKAMERFVEDHLAGRADQTQGLWLLLSLALWEDKHSGKHGN